MTTVVKLAVAAAPGGLLLLAVLHFLPCRHNFGAHGTRCTKCGHGQRQHPWGGEPVRYHSLLGARPAMPAPPPPATDIEREAERATAEDAAISTELRQQDRSFPMNAETRAVSEFCDRLLTSLMAPRQRNPTGIDRAARWLHENIYDHLDGASSDGAKCAICRQRAVAVIEAAEG